MTRCHLSVVLGTAALAGLALLPSPAWANPTFPGSRMESVVGPSHVGTHPLAHHGHPPIHHRFSHPHFRHPHGSFRSPIRIPPHRHRSSVGRAYAPGSWAPW